jgi:hypothetical protein
MPVSVIYNLTGAGWSECSIEIGDQQAHVTASYLSDALGDLLRAVVGLLRGARDATAAFAEEPGEYRWRLRCIGDGQVSVRILWFNDTFSRLPDERGSVILDAQCRLRTLTGAMLAASQHVLREHGLEGYARQWKNHEFPLEVQAELERLLDAGRERAT